MPKNLNRSTYTSIHIYMHIPFVSPINQAIKKAQQ